MQRFGSALNLNLHFHIVHVDGVFDRRPDGRLGFTPARPDTVDIEGLVVDIARACERWLRRHGGGDDDTPDPPADDVQTHLQLASQGNRVALGERAGAFKLSGTVGDTLRRDKFVAYFATREHMFEAGERLAAACRDVPVHPLPFSPRCSASGVVSWGVDPPHAAGMEPWQDRGSWRLWVCRRLAAALAASPHGGDVEGTVEAACARMEAEGVETSGWVPSEALLADWASP